MEKHFEIENYEIINNISFALKYNSSSDVYNDFYNNCYTDKYQNARLNIINYFIKNHTNVYNELKMYILNKYDEKIQKCDKRYLGLLDDNVNNDIESFFNFVEYLGMTTYIWSESYLFEFYISNTEFISELTYLASDAETNEFNFYKILIILNKFINH